MFRVVSARISALTRSHPEERVFFFPAHFLVLTLLPIRYDAFVGVVSPYRKGSESTD